MRYHEAYPTLKASTLYLKWKCGYCDQTNESSLGVTEIEHDGGCSGGHGDNYCYCPPISLHVKVTCECKKRSDIELPRY